MEERLRKMSGFEEAAQTTVKAVASDRAVGTMRRRLGEEPFMHPSGNCQ